MTDRCPVRPRGDRAGSRRAPWRPRLWLLAGWLAVLAGVGCEKEHGEHREIVLDFKDIGDATVTISVAGGNPDEQRTFEPGKVPMSVRIRIRGATDDTEVSVTIARPGKDPCTITIKVGDAGSSISVAQMCPPPDAGMPEDAGMVADAGSDPGAEVGPDVAPDLTPDTQVADTAADADTADCVRYCGVMRQKCPGVYTSNAECLETCGALGWPRGVPGVTAGNSLECRLSWAAQAGAADQLPHCFYAGPSGGNVCGTLCNNYCEAAERLCAPVLPGGTPQACRQAVCPLRPTPLTPQLRTESGDSLACRLHWLVKAGQDAQSCARDVPAAQDMHCRP